MLSNRYLSLDLNAHCVILTAILLLAPIKALAESGNTNHTRPNIVFLMSDDQCTYSLGCYGNEDVKTKNIDNLARDGMVFDNHYDTTAICMASRANVLTGLYEFKTGCNFNHGALVRNKWQQSYPVLLRKAGYLTAFAGKIGIEVADAPGGKSRLPEDDFDMWGAGPGQTHYDTKKNKSMAHYAAEYPHASRAYGAFGRDFIKMATDKKQPFCLSISFKAPHRPVQPDPQDDDVYKGQKFAKPENYGRQHGEHFSMQSRQGRQYERFHSWNYSDDYDGVMAKYHQQIFAVDAAVGMIRDALKEFSADKNTVIIFTSDNGFFCGSHGYGSKVLPYEEASRVPLIVFDPRHPSSGRHQRCESLTGNVDFAPTILRLAGLEIPKACDGEDLMKLLDDPADEIHPWLPLINVWGPSSVHSLSVVTKDWKYIYWPSEAKNMKATEELYDTGGDPLELSELAKDPRYADDLARMRRVYNQALDAWKKEAVPFHGYQPFGKIFDPKLPWTAKAPLLKNFGR